MKINIELDLTPEQVQDLIDAEELNRNTAEEDISGFFWGIIENTLEVAHEEAEDVRQAREDANAMNLIITLHKSGETIEQKINFADYSECDDAMDVSNILSDNVAGMLMGKNPEQNISYIVSQGRVIASALMIWDEDSYTDDSDESWRRMCERIADTFTPIDEI